MSIQIRLRLPFAYLAFTNYRKYYQISKRDVKDTRGTIQHMILLSKFFSVSNNLSFYNIDVLFYVTLYKPRNKTHATILHSSRYETCLKVEHVYLLRTNRNQNPVQPRRRI